MIPEPVRQQLTAGLTAVALEVAMGSEPETAHFLLWEMEMADHLAESECEAQRVTQRHYDAMYL